MPANWYSDSVAPGHLQPAMNVRKTTTQPLLTSITTTIKFLSFRWEAFAYANKEVCPSYISQRPRVPQQTATLTCTLIWITGLTETWQTSRLSGFPEVITRTCLRRPRMLQIIQRSIMKWRNLQRNQGANSPPHLQTVSSPCLNSWDGRCFCVHWFWQCWLNVLFFLSDSCGYTSGSESEVADDSEEEATQQKRMRTKFTSEQIRKLEDTFSKHKYLGATQRRKFAEKLNLSETQVGLQTVDRVTAAACWNLVVCV